MWRNLYLLVFAAGLATRLGAQCLPAAAPAVDRPPAGANVAAAPATPTPPPPMAVQVGQLQVSGVSRDRLQLSVPLTFIGQRNGTIRRVVVESLQVDGLPLYAAPVTTRLELRAGQPQSLPAPLAVSIYYRDLDSLSPLEQVLRDGRAHIGGTLVATAQLGLGARVLLATGTVQVPIDFQADVPVEVPGPLGARAAALTVVAAADVVLSRAENGAQSMLAAASGRRRDLLAQYGPLLASIETRFTLRGRAGEAAFVCGGIGLRIAPDRLLLLKSALQPWKYDGEMAVAMQAQHLNLDPKTYDVTATFAVGAPLRLSHGDLRLGAVPGDDAQQVFVPQPDGKMARVHLNRQESPANLATLIMTAPPAAGPAATFDRAPPAADAGLALFRLGRAGVTHPTLIFLDVTPAAAVLQLATPVDAAAWGAPLIGDHGIVGIVQSETSALPVALWGALLP